MHGIHSMKYTFIALLLIITNSTAINTNDFDNSDIRDNIDIKKNIVKAPSFNLHSASNHMPLKAAMKDTPLWLKQFDKKMFELGHEIALLESSTVISSVSSIISSYKRPDLPQIDSIDASFRILPRRKNEYTISYPFRNTEKASNNNYVTQVDNKAKKPNFWSTLYSVESKQGARLYRPRNRSKSCATTSAPCGHHQLSLQALRDIGCTSAQCKKDREDYAKSLAMSQKLQAINQKRLVKKGIKHTLPEYQRYLIHQQGAYGLKKIIAAAEGQTKLSKKFFKHMANNCSYSYKSLKKMGSKLAAKTFLQHWKIKWDNEKELIIVTRQELGDLPLFTDNELQVALNLNIRY